jgi:hypothetical protein
MRRGKRFFVKDIDKIKNRLKIIFMNYGIMKEYKMKNKSFAFVAGILAALPTVFVLIGFAGCPTSNEAERTTEEVAAAELAAAINAMEGQSEGHADVNGATVTITGGFVDVRTNLTVPAGVTLDVTEDGAALGLHNATVTVDGTVNAVPDSFCLEDTAEWGTINGSGTIRLAGKGSLFRVNGNKNRAARKLTLDGVTLVGLPDNSRPLVMVDGNVEKGYTGEFVLKNGAITGNTHNSDGWADGGGVAVWGGKFTMKGGVISGNTAGSDAGGVKVVHEGSFTLEGGRIQGGTDDGSYTKNSAVEKPAEAALGVYNSAAKWGTGGTYTKGGIFQTGGSGIDTTSDTLIAVPAP